mmetsp:Transcript_12352/g.26194  ORF Transcript_12352/g.26194 Transcript_12352/m.26194 type:complete len:623 (+) Transcript_12352:111-1979(+)
MNNDFHTTSTFDLPLHLLHEHAESVVENTTTSAPPSVFSRQRRRRGNEINRLVRLSLVSVALALLSSSSGNRASTSTMTTANCFANALSMSARTALGARSGVDQALLLRQKKFAEAPADARTMEPSSLDNDAWISALFGDLDSSDGVGADARLLEEKRRAEEFDRFMEDDATVASLVKEEVHPVKSARGADVGSVSSSAEEGGMGMEVFLKREAERRREAMGRSSVAAPSDSDSATSKTPSANKKKMKRSNSAAKLSAPRQSASKAKPVRETLEDEEVPQHIPSSKLLSREHEYRLAHAIQLGTRIHNLKSTHESTTGRSLTKKQWAHLADLSSPNELRRIISSYRSAKQELVSSNMGLVHAVVKTYRRKAQAKGISLEELVQEGSLGLIRAAELFDPAKGLRFSTYATIWIKGVLSNYSFDEMIALPSREKTKWNKIQKAIQDLEALGTSSSSEDDSSATKKAASPSELAEYLGMKTDEVETTIRRMSRARNVLSLDYQYTTSSRSGYAEGNNNLDLLNTYRGTSSSSSSNSADSDADLAERAHLQTDVLSTLLSHLTSREVQLLRLRYGLEDGQERTIKECAEIMGMNRETARKLQHACLEKLRDARDVGSLQEYLLTVA